MGLIKGGLLSLAAFLLFFSLLIGNIFLTLNLSLSNSALKESVASNIDEIVKTLAGDNAGETSISKEIEQRTDEMKEYCGKNESTEFVFSTEQGYTITIPCETVSQGDEAIMKKGIEEVIDGIYYKNHECGSIIKCVVKQNDPSFLVSKQANASFGNMFYLFAAASILLVLMMFFLVENKSSLPIIVGALAILSSLPFAKLDVIFSLFSFSYLKLVPIILSKSRLVFIIMISLGVVLVAIGIALKFFNVGHFLIKKLEKSSDAIGRKNAGRKK